MFDGHKNTEQGILIESLERSVLSKNVNELVGERVKFTWIAAWSDFKYLQILFTVWLILA